MDLLNQSLYGAISAWMLTAGFTTAAALGFGIAWIRSLLRIRRLEARQVDSDPVRRFAGDLEVMRRNLSDVGEDLERVVEGQEFLTRLIAERTTHSQSVTPFPSNPQSLTQ